MSRYYELMQQMAKQQPLLASRVVQPAFPLPAPVPARDPGVALDSRLMQPLVEKVFFQPEARLRKVTLFAAVDSGTGCSGIAAMTARCLAATTSRSVCLVDANFYRAGLSMLLGTTNYHGLTNALLADDPIRSFLKPVDRDSFHLLSTGAVTSESAALLSSERMRARLVELRNEFDYVLIDAPPVARYAEALGLARMSDGLILVLEAESTRREAARAAVRDLRMAGIPILGAVLNNRTYPIPEKIYRLL
jgi:Mrp family chromosome partitioning ATPase